MQNAMKRFPLSTNVDTAKKFEDLLLFGYQSTIFNDDEKALFVDQGKHLIPWMGDETLMIDRYDGRGHLSDITTYDADLTKGRWQPLNDREKQIEAMLDEERYYELNNDFHEKMLYEEEELKRLSEALADNSYAAVAFNYDDQQQDGQEATGVDVKVGDAAEEEAEVEEEDYFTMPSNLNISPDIPIPTSMRQYSVIERTAMFVSKQGSQMEIVIKTKQKDNPAFQFLDFTNPLYLFYKHLVELVKTGKFIPNVSKMKVINQPEAVQDSHRDYQISSTDFLQSIQEKLPAGQIANTPYARLLSNLAKLAPQPNISAPQSVDDEIDSTSVRALTPPPPPPPLEEDRESTDEEDLIYRDSPKNELMEMSEIIPPPPDQQPIIDKMAEYVIRNGPEFEELVRLKKDKRFAFLDNGHHFRNYYVYKKQIYAQKKEDAEKRVIAERETKREESEGFDEKSSKEPKLIKLVDYEFNESSQLLVSYNSDSDGSDYNHDDDNNGYGVVKANKIVDYEPDEPQRVEPKDKISDVINVVSNIEGSEDNAAIKKSKILVNYDDEGDDDVDTNYANLKSLVPNYCFDNNDNMDENVKKKKKRRRSRTRVYGPSLPDEIKLRKSKREKIFGPNLPEHFNALVDSPGEVKNPEINDENIDAANLTGVSTRNNISDINVNCSIVDNESVDSGITSSSHIQVSATTVSSDDVSTHIIDKKSYKKRKKIYGPELPDNMIFSSKNEEDDVDNIGVGDDIENTDIICPTSELIGGDNFDPLRSEEAVADESDHKQLKENRKTKRRKLFGRHLKKQADASQQYIADASDLITSNSDSLNNISDSVTEIKTICGLDFSIDPSATFLPSNLSTFNTKTNSPQLPSIEESACETTYITDNYHHSNNEEERIVNEITADLLLCNPKSLLSTDLTSTYLKDQNPINIDQSIPSTSNYDVASNEDENSDDSDNNDHNYKVNEEALEAEGSLKDDVNDFNMKDNNNLSDCLGHYSSSDDSGNPDGEVCPEELIRMRKDSEDRKKMLKSISFTIKTKPREDEAPKVRQNIFKNILSSEAEDEPEEGDRESDVPPPSRAEAQRYVERPIKTQTTDSPREDCSVVLERGPVIYTNIAPTQQWEGNEIEGRWYRGQTAGDIWGGQNQQFDQIALNQHGVYDGWVGGPDRGQAFQNEWSQTFEEKTYSMPVFPSDDPPIFDPYKAELTSTADDKIEKEVTSKLTNQQIDGVSINLDKNSPPPDNMKNHLQSKPIAPPILDSTTLDIPNSTSSHQATSSSLILSSLLSSFTSQPASPMTILAEARISPLVRKSRNCSKSGSESSQRRHKKSGKSGHKKKKHKKDGSFKRSRKHEYESPPQPQLKRYLREEDIEERMRVLNEAIERRVLREEREKRKRKKKREKKRRAEMDYQSCSSDDDKAEAKKKKVPTATLR